MKEFTKGLSNRAIRTPKTSPDEAQLKFIIGTLSHFKQDLEFLLGADLK